MGLFQWYQACAVGGHGRLHEAEPDVLEVIRCEDAPADSMDQFVHYDQHYKADHKDDQVDFGESEVVVDQIIQTVTNHKQRDHQNNRKHVGKAHVDGQVSPGVSLLHHLSCCHLELLKAFLLSCGQHLLIRVCVVILAHGVCSFIDVWG